MRPVPDKNFLANLNTIEQGLNFVVPKPWWDNFSQNNQHIKCYKEMRLEEYYPLDYLFQTQVIQHSMPQNKKKLENIVEQSNASLKNIKRQIKNAEIERKNNGMKRGRPLCQWLWSTQNIQKQNIDLLLCGPKINPDTAEMFGIGNDNWVVVSPELYRLIWQCELHDKRIEKDNIIVGIPIIVKKYQDAYPFINRTIEYHKLQYFQFLISNSQKKTFVFMGYLDSNIKIKKMLKYINEGMYKLLHSGRQRFTFKGKNILMTANGFNGTIYDFYDEEYQQSLKWAQLDTIKEHNLSQSSLYKFIVFSGSKSNQRDKENQPQGTSFKRIKRVNSDISAQSDPGTGSNFVRRVETRPIIQGQRRIPQQVEVIDVHSSTQEQTPSDLGPRENFVQTPPPTVKYQRIVFPLWKDPYPQNLMRLSQIKSTVPKICKPYSDQGTIIIRDEGKKIVLPKESNELILNQSGEYEQKQIEQKVAEENELVSKSVSRQLEMLAMQVLGMKISDYGEKVEEKMEADWVKQSSQYEDIVTCKNDLDEYDEQESNVQ